MLAIRRILVPTDFSDAAGHALRYAIELASKLGSEIDLLHVWQLSAYASPISELAKSVEEDLTRELEGVVARYGAHGVVLRHHLRLGVPYVGIVEAANDLECDLIVMGTTGRTGLQHFLLGSVAERVVRTASCPVLTIRYGAKR
jgi:nucleotide-binding universal stress UspA family protein